MAAYHLDVLQTSNKQLTAQSKVSPERSNITSPAVPVLLFYSLSPKDASSIMITGHKGSEIKPLVVSLMSHEGIQEDRNINLAHMLMLPKIIPRIHNHSFMFQLRSNRAHDVYLCLRCVAVHDNYLTQV